MKKVILGAVFLILLAGCYKEKNACEDSLNGLFAGSIYSDSTFVCDSMDSITEKIVTAYTASINPTQSTFLFYIDSTKIDSSYQYNFYCEKYSDEYSIIARDCNGLKAGGYDLENNIIHLNFYSPNCNNEIIFVGELLP